MSKLRWQNSNGDIELVEVNQQWLNEHDEQIRADERAKILMPYDVESIDDLIENVRAKVLDEFEARLEKHQQDNWVDNLEYGITFADIDEVIEEMKRNK